MNEIAESLRYVRNYLDSHKIALARFLKDGEVEQGEWAAKYLLSAQLHAADVAKLGGTLPAELADVMVPQQAKPAPKKARCDFYKHIKAFFACARENGLDTNAKEACRAAIGMFLGRRILSREDLTGPEWQSCTLAIGAGKLFW